MSALAPKLLQPVSAWAARRGRTCRHRVALEERGISDAAAKAAAESRLWLAHPLCPIAWVLVVAEELLAASTEKQQRLQAVVEEVLEQPLDHRRLC